MTDSSPDPQASPPSRVGDPAEDAVATGGGRLEVSGTQVAASVLASVSAAVVASFFGVAGTIIGTAVVSVVATVGSAAYSLGIRRTQHRLHKLQALRPTRAVPSIRTEDEVTPDARSEADGARADDPMPAVLAASADGGWRGWLAERRWGVAAGVAIVFVLSLVSVTLLELAGDRTLARTSSGSARTSIGALVFGDGSDADSDGGGTGDGGSGDGGDVDDGGTDPGGTDGRDPASESETVPGDTTTTSQPGGATSTTATDPSTDGGDPAGSTTSTTATTSPAEPSADTTTTVPDGQAAPPPVPTTAAPAPAD